jgi:hypothetical protein
MRSAIIENGVVVNIIVGSIPGMACVLIPENQQVDFGYVWDGTTFSAPVADIAALKTAKNAEINLARATANQTSFTYSGKLIACDQLSRSDIDATNGSVALNGAMPPAWPGAWKAMDNSYVAIPDVATWKAFYAAMVAQGTANFGKAQTLKTQLAAATTAAQIAAVVWQ